MTGRRPEGDVTLTDCFVTSPSGRRPVARSLMIQGTGSHVGKSIIVAGLCRILHQDGFRVAPFKSQNMSNNSYVTEDEKEMGRAQAVQAEAACVTPRVDMNPILLKPASDVGAQVILHGKPYRIMNAQDYQFHTLDLLHHVRESFERLAQDFDRIVIEGAGSPAEINLQAFDIANMRMAEMANAPVILVGDIDRGGVFASLVGTLELILPRDRERIKGFVINKFRGDLELLRPGLEYLEKRTGIPVLGVLPYMKDLEILEEDGLSDARIERNKVVEDPKKILIDVIWLPRISNVTDFSVFDSQPDVVLTYLRRIPKRLPDVLILPGTKSTTADLEYLHASGFARWIHEYIEAGGIVIGICGGYQMLGKRIFDPCDLESSSPSVEGLGYFPVETVFKAEKITKQVTTIHLKSGQEVSGYEIHMGETNPLWDTDPVFEVIQSGNNKTSISEGCAVLSGRVWGTYLHGVFDNKGFLRYFLNNLRVKKGLAMRLDEPVLGEKDELYDRLADVIRTSINMDLFYKILGSSLKSYV